MYYKKMMKILLILAAIILLMGVTCAAEISLDKDTDYTEKIVADETGTQTHESIVTATEKSIKEKNSHKNVIKKNTTNNKNEVYENRIPTKLSLNLNKKNVNICESFTIYGQLTDENNTPLKNKNIQYYLNDELQKTAKTDNNGIFSLEENINKTLNYVSNNYFSVDISVKFIDSSVKTHYLSSENKTTTRVYVPLFGYIYAYHNNIRLGQTNQIEVNVYRANYKRMPNQNITITYNHESLENETIINTKTDQRGVFKFNITPTNLGSYHLALYAQNNNSYFEMDDDLFNVNTYGLAQIETSPEIWSCRVGKGDNVIIYGRVSDIVSDEGVPFHRIDNAYMTNDPDNDPSYVKHPFYKNIPLNTTTDKNGNYLITIPFKQLPEKSIGSSYYCILSSNRTKDYITFDSYEGYAIVLDIVNRTSIKLDKIQATECGKTANITGKLVDNQNKSIKNARIKLIINDKRVNVTTDNQGIFNYAYKTRQNGYDNVTAYYRGNKEHGATLSTSKIHVVNGTKISVNKINTIEYKDKIMITGKLKSNSGDILPNTILKLKINNRTTQIKTDENGTYSYTHKAYTVGTNNITLSFAGNTYYKATTKNTTFKVVQRTTYLTITRITQKTYKDNVTITGKLTDKSGRIPKNTNINIRVNNKKYYVKTDATGLYVLQVAANRVGINNISVTYYGNTNYKATSRNTTFKTVARPSILTVDKINSASKGQTVMISGKLTDNLSLPVMNTHVKINVNTKTVSVKTDKSGVYTYNYKTTTSGTNNVTVTFRGGTNYKKTNVKTSFSVK